MGGEGRMCAGGLEGGGDLSCRVCCVCCWGGMPGMVVACVHMEQVGWKAGALRGVLALLSNGGATLCPPLVALS